MTTTTTTTTSSHLECDWEIFGTTDATGLLRRRSWWPGFRHSCCSCAARRPPSWWSRTPSWRDWRLRTWLTLRTMVGYSPMTTNRSWNIFVKLKGLIRFRIRQSVTWTFSTLILLLSLVEILLNRAIIGCKRDFLFYLFNSLQLIGLNMWNVTWGLEKCQKVSYIIWMVLIVL